MIEIELSDGNVLEFPEGTTKGEIRDAVTKFEAQRGTAPQGEPSNTERFFGGAYDTLLSPLDAIGYPGRALAEALGLGEVRAPSAAAKDFMRDQGAAIAPEDAAPADTMGGRAAELAGGGLGFIAPGYGAASMLARYGGPTAGALGQQLLNTYRASPGGTAAAEVAAGAGAGVAGYKAEQAAEDAGLPPEVGQIPGELIGGLVGAGLPAATRTAAEGAGRTVGPLIDMVPGLSVAKRSATQIARPDVAAFDRASSAVRERLETSPEEAAAALRNETLLDLSPAQRVGQDRMLKLEQDALKLDPQLDAQYKARTTEAQQTATREIEGVGEGGAISDTVRAMDAYTTTAREALESTAADAVRRAEDAITRAGPQNMMGQSERSRVFRDELDTAYSDVRAEERKLWDAIPKGQMAGTTNAEAAYNLAATRATDVSADKIPATAKRFLDPESPDYFGGEVEIARAKRLSSDLREDARAARSQGQAFTAMMADDLAEAITQDLDAVPGVGGPLDTARSFSREFNQIYRTGPVAEVLGTSRAGGDRVAPEETLRRLFGSTGERATTRAQAVEDAVGPEALRGGARPDAQRQAADYLRRDFQDTIMDEAGNIRLPRAETFTAKRRELLDTYPALGQLMDDAVSAARNAQTTRKTVESELADIAASPAQRLVNAKEHKEFSTILNNAQSPAADFLQLRQVAEEAGPEAVDGLKASAASFLLNGAKTRADGELVLSGDGILNVLRDPRTMDAMSNVLDPDELQRINRVADELTVFSRSERAARGQTSEIIPQDPVDTVLGLVGRVLGAAGGRAASPQGQATLIYPQVGSSMLQKFARRLTTENASQLVVDAVTDNPDLFRALLLNQRTAPPDMVSRADAVLQRWATNNISRAALDADDALEDFKSGLGLPQVNLPDPYTDNPFMPR